MTLPELHGVVPILLTPFDARGRIDAESLRNLVDFTIEAGVHGLGIALGSEIYKLTESEREIVSRTVIDQVKGTRAGRRQYRRGCDRSRCLLLEPE